MGRIHWLERLDELNSLGAGSVMLSTGSSKGTPSVKFIVELPVGIVNPDIPLPRVEAYYSFHYEDLGYSTTSGYGDTLPAAVYSLWERLAYEPGKHGYVLIKDKDGNKRAIRRSGVTTWEPVELPE